MSLLSLALLPSVSRQKTSGFFLPRGAPNLVIFLGRGEGGAEMDAGRVGRGGVV